jgi:hypothetical protein
MSLSTRNPLRMLGATNNSGCPNTGELQMTLGGAQRACVFSGMPSGAYAGGVAPQAGAYLISGADAVIYSGPGRIKDIMLHTQMISGLPIYFYDANTVVSGGPFAASGHCIVAIGPATWSPAAAASGAGATSITPYTGAPYSFDIPFNNGLCVDVKSGQPGFTVVFTPETNQTTGV